MLPKGAEALLGRGTEGLFKCLRKTNRFLYAFTNNVQHATVLEGSATKGKFETKLTAYFTCSERVPYADSISQLRYKMRPILSTLRQLEAFEGNVNAPVEVKVNEGQEWIEHPPYEDGRGYPLSGITPGES